MGGLRVVTCHMTTPAKRRNRFVAAWHAFRNPPILFDAADMEFDEVTIADIHLMYGWKEGTSTATWTRHGLLQIEEDDE